MLGIIILNVLDYPDRLRFSSSSQTPSFCHGPCLFLILQEATLIPVTLGYRASHLFCQSLPPRGTVLPGTIPTTVFFKQKSNVLLWVLTSPQTTGANCRQLLKERQSPWYTRKQALWPSRDVLLRQLTAEAYFLCSMSTWPHMYKESLYCSCLSIHPFSGA